MSRSKPGGRRHSCKGHSRHREEERLMKLEGGRALGGEGG